MFKVLDIREHKYSIAHTCGTGSSYSSNVSINNETRHEFIVICDELETGNRKRFVFTEGHCSKSCYDGSYRYYGYQGDYDLLVVGDIFKIEPTNTYDEVVILEYYVAP